MLNRRHIRVKVMQALYAYYCSDGGLTTIEVSKELIKNQKRLYELYLYFLLFVKELISFVESYDDLVKARNIPSIKEKTMNTRFYDNPIAHSLATAKSFETALNKNKLFWDAEDSDILRKVFFDLKTTDIYHEFIHSESLTGVDNKELFSYIIKHYPENFSLLEQHFEEKYINWFDDYKIAIQMAAKTFQYICTNPDSDDFLQTLTDVENESLGFSTQLFDVIVSHDEYLSELVKQKVDKWEPSRLPLVDTVILKIGIAEFLYFPSIPVKVSINECIELAKNYCAPNSKKFINGVLDNVLTELKKEGKIEKTGMGLVDG